MLCLLDAPIRPLIILSDVVTPLVDRQNITLTCSGGRPPAVRLTWMRKLPGRHTWLQLLQNDSVTKTTDDVGVSARNLLVSRVKLALSASDDGVVYRCLAMDGGVMQASASYTLRVQCKGHPLCRAVHLSPVSTTRVDGPCWPLTRAVNSGSGNRALDYQQSYLKLSNTDYLSITLTNKNKLCVIVHGRVTILHCYLYIQVIKLVFK